MTPFPPESSPQPQPAGGKPGPYDGNSLGATRRLLEVRHVSLARVFGTARSARPTCRSAAAALPGGPEPRTLRWGRRPPTVTGSGSAGTRAGPETGTGRALPQHRAGLERPEPARAHRRSVTLARVLRPRARRHRIAAGPADQLPSLPPRPMAVRCTTEAICGLRRGSRRDLDRSRSTRRLLPADRSGPTDSEVLFHLALTLGLTEDPVGAVWRGRSASSRPSGHEPRRQASRSR